jgi:hypothetical protein
VVYFAFAGGGQQYQMDLTPGWRLVLGCAAFAAPVVAILIYVLAMFLTGSLRF